MPQNPLIKFEYVVKNITLDPLDVEHGAAPVINYENHTQFENAISATNAQRFQSVQNGSGNIPGQIEVWQHGPR